MRKHLSLALLAAAVLFGCQPASAQSAAEPTSAKWIPVTFYHPVGGSAASTGNGNWTIAASAQQPVFSDIAVTLDVGDKLEVIGLFGGQSAANNQWGGIYVDTYETPTNPRGTLFSYIKGGNVPQTGIWLLGAGGDNCGSNTSENPADPSDLYASLWLYSQSPAGGYASYTVRHGGAAANCDSEAQALATGLNTYYIGVDYYVAGSYSVQGMHYRVIHGGS